MPAILAGIMVTVLFNFAVTIAVLLSRSLEPSQKFYQTLIVWLLPVIGATLCVVLLREPRGSGGSMNAPDIGFTPGMDGNVLPGDHNGGH